MDEKKDQNELMEDIKPYEKVSHGITVDIPSFFSLKSEIDNNQPRKSILADFSLWLLLFSNITTIYFAINQNWNVVVLIWIYWSQSIVIGLFNFIRILQLKEFTTDGIKINGRSVSPTNSTKIFTAFFFLLHFGGFHFVYFMFMKNINFIKGYENIINISEYKYILLSVLLFFINHLFSYFYNKPNDTKKLNIGLFMFYPYARIIPMHLIIMFGTIFNGSLTIFLGLKTIADITMHIFEHRFFR